MRRKKKKRETIKSLDQREREKEKENKNHNKSINNVYKYTKNINSILLQQLNATNHQIQETEKQLIQA